MSRSTRKAIKPKKATDAQLIPIVRAVRRQTKGKVVPYRLLTATRAAGYKGDTERLLRLWKEDRRRSA